MANINAPLSRKLIGLNLVPPPATSWASLYSAWDWTGWIKPQIDHAVGNGVGVNCLRLMGDYAGVKAGTFTQATYNAHMVQFVSYCAGLGVRVYLCGGDQSEVAGMTNAEIYGNCNSLLSALSGYTNIIGMDVMQEQNGWTDGSAATRTIAIYNGIKAGGTTIPLTFSTTAQPADTTGRSWIASISTALDFLDFHPYAMNAWPSKLAASDMNYWRSTYPALDIVFGEYGTDETQSADIHAIFARGVLDVANQGDPKFRGCFMWSVQDQSTTTGTKYGIYDGSWNKRLLGNVLRQYTGGYVVPAI